MSDRDVLVSMGFEAPRVDWALKATNNRGLQPAMDHILENQDKPVPDPTTVTYAPMPSRGGDAMDVDEDDEDLDALKAVYGAGATATSGEAEAKSIKCSQCGKIFKNTALANYHAEKSGHDQFEESTEEVKPLTEEEKKQKLEDLKEKMAEKRAKKALEDAKAAKINEEIRRKSGKDVGKLKEEMKSKEIIKEAERKKQEKLDDAKAKAKIKAQIEVDKKERAERIAREKAIRDGTTIPEPSSSKTTAPPVSKPAVAVAGKDFKETRLQIRMATGGQPYVTTLSSDAPLREVAEFLAGQTLDVDVETVNLAQHFPRKAFTQADFSKSLRELGLTPSAVLIAT